MTKRVIDQLEAEQRRLSVQLGHSKEKTEREVAGVRAARERTEAAERAQRQGR